MMGAESREADVHETERHRIILSAVAAQSVVTVTELCALAKASEATIRRDIAALAAQGQLHRVRGGAQSLHPVPAESLQGRAFSVSETINIAQKRAIARVAAEMCVDGEAIIINGGTTTFQMGPFLTQRQLSVFTNSFAMAEFLIRNSRNAVTIPGGTIYREQNVILSPFGGVVASHFHARRMFIGCQGLGPRGLMEADPLLVQSELALIGQAEELVVLADSSKFRARPSLILCGLEKVSAVITDHGLRDEDRQMLEDAGVRLILVEGDKG